MKEVSLKYAQIAFQKTITWNKKFGKGKLEWENKLAMKLACNT